MTTSLPLSIHISTSLVHICSPKYFSLNVAIVTVNSSHNALGLLCLPLVNVTVLSSLFILDVFCISQ